MTFIECDFEQPAVPEIPALPAIPEIPAIPAIVGRCQKWTWSERARGKSTSSTSIHKSGHFKPKLRSYRVFDLLIYIYIYTSLT